MAFGIKLATSRKDNSLDESGFIIDRRKESDTFAKIAIVSSCVNTFDDLMVSPLKMYTYRTRSFNAFVSSTYTDGASVSTPACGVLSNPPFTLEIKLVS
ncbi:MAG: hypothetical protein ACPLKS_07650 [Caldisericum exile]|uniref:hypothetical protein n=1 Tax=Caldisericum exile TaxID=693075 RepID=UPI003C74F96C